MPKKSKILDQNLTDLAKNELKKLGKYGVTTKKLQAIISANTHGIKKVAHIYGISERSLSSWIKKFKTENVDGLIPRIKKPRKSKLEPVQQENVKQWLEESPNVTIRELKIMIKEQMDIELGKSTIHRLIKKLGYSHITSRPKHYKQDEDKLNQFKKNSD